MTLRGWNSGAPQAPGMWFQVELPQPVLLTEVQFDSPAHSEVAVAAARLDAAHWRAAPARAGAPARRHPAHQARPAAARTPSRHPRPGYPRAYSVQVSMDGKKWSKPVAEGKGEGARTTITFAPTRAQFVRITQTDNIADAPAWTIRGLRLYEARSGTGTPFGHRDQVAGTTSRKPMSAWRSPGARHCPVKTGRRFPSDDRPS